jgi:UDP-2-acetamido-2,6-beta-L-arabino-hexul-4-ose reductase
MVQVTPQKIVVTGAAGLVGWHCAARLHAANCAARYRGETEPYELALLTHEGFADDKMRDAAIHGAAAVLHFAGINRGEPDDVEAGNPAIAEALADSLLRTRTKAHIVYANSTHAAFDSPYGRSKKRAADILADVGNGFSNLILPHVFGECARPNYNNVTATLIDQIWAGQAPTINPAGEVCLLHAGKAANLAIKASLNGVSETIEPEGRPMSIIDLYDRLVAYHHAYCANIFPDLTDPFDLALFNAYRAGGYPARYPIRLKQINDARGTLFESAKATAGSQTFLSTTAPGMTRGDHFHIDLVERFVVVSGRATIRVRKVLTDEVHSFSVSGEEPVAIDMPPLHTHHIVNDSGRDVVTFFWSHRLFDPSNPDTYADPVLIQKASR